MCKSRAEGGQRCATHTRPKYLEAISPAETKDTLEFDEQILLGAATVPYATTIKGIRVIKDDIERFDAEGKIEVAAILRIALNEGIKQREETKEIELQIYCHVEAHRIAEGCLEMCYESGFTLWEAYKKVNEIADSLVENITLEATVSKISLEVANERIRLSENISRHIKSLVLDFYASAASSEDDETALMERDSTKDILGELKVDPDFQYFEDLFNSDGAEEMEEMENPDSTKQ